MGPTLGPSRGPLRGPSSGAVPLPLTSGQRARAAELLALGSSGAVLAALDAGDPLGIGDRVHHCLRRGAWLVDPQELRRAALARIALEADGWSGRPRIERWLDGHIEAALGELVQGSRYARFHALPFDVRDLFCRALLDGEDPETLARTRCGDLSRFGRALLLGLEALLAAGGEDPGISFDGEVTPGEAARPSGVASS